MRIACSTVTGSGVNRSCPPREGSRPPVLLVHLPDLGRDEEPRDDADDDDVDDEAEHSADALAGVVLALVLGLEE
jgi:hypothetical protein